MKTSNSQSSRTPGLPFSYRKVNHFYKVSLFACVLSSLLSLHCYHCKSMQVLCYTGPHRASCQRLTLDFLLGWALRLAFLSLAIMLRVEQHRYIVTDRLCLYWLFTTLAIAMSPSWNFIQTLFLNKNFVFFFFKFNRQLWRTCLCGSIKTNANVTQKLLIIALGSLLCA